MIKIDNPAEFGSGRMTQAEAAALTRALEAKRRDFAPVNFSEGQKLIKPLGQNNEAQLHPWGDQIGST